MPWQHSNVSQSKARDSILNSQQVSFKPRSSLSACQELHEDDDVSPRQMMSDRLASKTLLVPTAEAVSLLVRSAPDPPAALTGGSAPAVAESLAPVGAAAGQ